MTVTLVLQTRVDGGPLGLVRRAGRSWTCMWAWRVAWAIFRNARSVAVGCLVRQQGEAVVYWSLAPVVYESVGWFEGCPRWETPVLGPRLRVTSHCSRNRLLIGGSLWVGGTRLCPSRPGRCQMGQCLLVHLGQLLGGPLLWAVLCFHRPVHASG